MLAALEPTCPSGVVEMHRQHCYQHPKVTDVSRHTSDRCSAVQDVKIRQNLSHKLRVVGAPRCRDTRTTLPNLRKIYHCNERCYRRRSIVAGLWRLIFCGSLAIWLILVSRTLLRLYTAFQNSLVDVCKILENFWHLGARMSSVTFEVVSTFGCW